jgi:teichoic acid transport system ATP-binding protein
MAATKKTPAVKANVAAKAKAAAKPKVAAERKPVVIVDGVHVIYKVYASGKRVTRGQGKNGIFSKTTNLREVHAVKGVSFTVYEGESIGIVGSNGSGKSTLLRAISGLTPTDGGSIYAIARPTLLGVGGALLPNISGERNILLGGMAMGESRKDMEKAIDEIAEFAGLQEFIDLPMRTYSSGMAARLKFAIAAHRDHDILIVDEALSVGDKQFQNRSEARMRQLRENAGTVFLVSHSMESILETCNRVIWLEKGEIRMDGAPKKVVAAYSKYMEDISK